MGYIGSQPATNFETVRKQVSTTNSGTTITLDYSVSSVQDILVTVNAVVQSYDNYSVSGTTLTLGGTLNNDRVEILYVGRTFQTVTPAVGTVTNEMLSGNIANSKLANSSITLNGSSVSLGGSASVGGDNTPLFDARIQNAYSISSSTDTLINANVEIHDVGGCYNNTNGSVTLNGLTAPAYSFTPNVAGKYYIFFNCGFGAAGDSQLEATNIYIRKNGSTYQQGHQNLGANPLHFLTLNISAIITFNGTGDYVQFYSFIEDNSGSPIQQNDVYTNIGGYKLIE